MVHGDRMSLRVVSGHSPRLARSLPRVPSWSQAYRSAKIDSREEESGSLVVSFLFWHLLNSLGFVFGNNTGFFIGPSLVRQLRQAGRARASGFGQQFPNTVTCLGREVWLHVFEELCGGEGRWSGY